MNFFQVSSKNNIKYTTWVNVFSYFPGLTFALLLVKMSKSGFSKGNKRKQKKHTLCIKILVIFLAHYICHIQKPQSKNSVLTLLSRLSVLKQMNDSLLYCTGREYSSYFTRLLQSKKGDKKMNFPWSSPASFQGQIGYWSPSLCLLRESLACQNWSPPWRLPISQCWLILCRLWLAEPNQGWWERGWGWWERGWGWLSAVTVSLALSAHDQ